MTNRIYRIRNNFKILYDIALLHAYNIKTIISKFHIAKKNPLLDWSNLGKAHALVPEFEHTTSKHFSKETRKINNIKKYILCYLWVLYFADQWPNFSAQSPQHKQLCLLPYVIVRPVSVNLFPSGPPLLYRYWAASNRLTNFVWLQRRLQAFLDLNSWTGDSGKVVRPARKKNNIEIFNKEKCDIII